MYWVQTTIERTDVHISEIAFPAITICPTHLKWENLNGTNTKHIELNRLNRLYNLVHAIQWNPRVGDQITEEDFLEFKDYYNQSLADIGDILDHNYKCEELFMQCMWRRREVDCCSFFRRFDFGISCYTFNSLYAINADPTWPWSVAGSGFNSGLNVKLHRYVGDVRFESIGVSF